MASKNLTDSEPLPPIGSARSQASGETASELGDHDSDQETDTENIKQSIDSATDDRSQTSSRASSAALDQPGEGKARPAIVRGFRRESDVSEKEFKPEIPGQKQKGVSFTSSKKQKSSAGREVRKMKTYDGREITFITEDTQTDWSWVEEMTKSGKQKERKRKTRSSSKGTKVPENPKQTTPAKLEAPGSSAKQTEVDKEVAPSDEESTPRAEEPVQKTEETSKKEEERLETTSPFHYPPNDEFGIPMLELSSDTDTSSDEETSRKLHEDRAYLPSVGPPQILQYNRESEKQEMDMGGMFEPIEEGSETEPFPVDEQGRPLGMFGGPCEFCNNEIKPFPTLDQQQNFPPEELYCCNQYRDFVEYATSHANKMEEEHRHRNKVISVKVHPHHGDKQARKAARERAEKKMREREMQKRQQENTGLSQQANFLASAEMPYLSYPISLPQTTGRSSKHGQSKAAIQQNYKENGGYGSSEDSSEDSDSDSSSEEESSPRKQSRGSVGRKVSIVDDSLKGASRASFSREHSLELTTVKTDRQSHMSREDSKASGPLSKEGVVFSTEEAPDSGNEDTEIKTKKKYRKKLYVQESGGLYSREGTMESLVEETPRISKKKARRESNSLDDRPGSGEGTSRSLKDELTRKSKKKKKKESHVDGLISREGTMDSMKDESPRKSKKKRDTSPGRKKEHKKKKKHKEKKDKSKDKDKKEKSKKDKEYAGPKADTYKGLNFDIARQMKTINYMLSSQRCMEEGWTLRAPSPLHPDELDDVFIPEPLDKAMIATGILKGRRLIEKFYDDGQKFLTMFPDGTGSVFYPSGNLAITISSVELGQYTYVIQEDTDRPIVLAVFEPNGFASCYHPTGVVRLYMDQFGGLELDVFGGKKRKWNWKDPDAHVHAPPFQPICFGLNKHTGIRIAGQEKMSLTFGAVRKSCRFNVGAKLKLVHPQNIPPKEIDDNMIFLEEKKNKVEALLNRVATLLKFPKSPKIDKILPPLSLTARIGRTEKLKQEKAQQMASLEAKKNKQPSIVTVS